MANAPSVLSAGQVVADTYEIERPLGRGGMGEVWLARHRRLAGKQVAIKVLHLGGGGANPDVLARFRREAEIAARLEHPHIVQVLDFNTLPSGEPFLVMEALKGEPLTARLRNGALPLAEAQALLRQAGSALAAAHAAGVVHRDLKPDNLFVVPTALGDTVKVLDFGISKLADSKTVQTTDSVLIGTPLYMSPEQALGQNRDITPQSDVFSLGSICYELLTGQAPFQADNIAKVVFRIAYEPHAPLAQLAPHLPPEVVRAVDRALAKKREDRTPDVATFVREFTGQALGEVRQQALRDSGQGLYTPGMSVSESLMGGATVTPRTGRSSQPPPPPDGLEGTLASGRHVVAAPSVGGALSPAPVAAAPVPAATTPAPGAQTPGPASPSTPAVTGPGLVPPPRSMGPLVLGSVLAAVGVGAALWAGLGGKGPTPGVLAVDAGPVVTVVAAAPVDAGAGVAGAGDVGDAGGASEADAGALAAAGLDAGPSAVGSAPAAPVKPRPAAPEAEGPLEPEDRSFVEQVEGLVAAGRFDEVDARFSSRTVAGRAAQRRYYLALAMTQCQRRDLSKLNAALRHLDEAFPQAAKRARTMCQKAWPEYVP